jgi:hypothetical protein
VLEAAAPCSDWHRAFALAVTGMQRQGCTPQFTALCRALFYVTGMAHSIVDGAAWG